MATAAVTCIAFAVAVSSLVACVSQQSAAAGARAQASFVGMSKRDLLSCAGAPQRQNSVEDWEYLTYIGGGDTSRDAAAGQIPPNATMGVSGRDQPYCEAKFVLKFGAVQGVSYQSRTDDVAKKGEPCAFLVEKCAKP